MRRWFSLVVGLALGASLALVELPYVLIRWPRSWARSLTEAERRRLVRWHEIESSAEYTDRQAVRYLALRSLTGLFGGGMLGLLVFGFGSAVLALNQLIAGRLDLLDLTALIPLGLLLLFAGVQGLLGVTRLERTLAVRCLGPSEQELLRQRIAELATSRAGVIEAVDAERRRIERDLHDGVQQRLVALAMLLGRTRRRAPSDRDDLLVQAHEDAQEILNDLRDVAWRVYPTVLDNLGLEEVLAGVAERAGLPVTLNFISETGLSDMGLSDRGRLNFASETRLPARLETAAYFVVSEAVTNAAKHSQADLVTVEVARHESMVVVRITDNGIGGADSAGGGLSGLARRVAALDGRLTVDSPSGGPTVITAELPYPVAH